jgi:RNA polymerase sigma factor (sigma-70 family)
MLFTGLEAWFRADAGQLLQYVRRVLTDEGVSPSVLEPQDVVQEAFEALHRNFDKVDNPAGFLRTVARRMVLREAVKRGRRVVPVTTETVLTTPGVRWVSVAPVSSMDDLLVVRNVLHIAADLPERQREVFYWRYIEEYTYSEIAEVLQIAEGTVGVHAGRAASTVRHLAEADQRVNLSVPCARLFVSGASGAGKTTLIPAVEEKTEWTWCSCWSGQPERRVSKPVNTGRSRSKRWHTQAARAWWPGKDWRVSRRQVVYWRQAAPKGGGMAVRVPRRRKTC